MLMSLQKITTTERVLKRAEQILQLFREKDRLTIRDVCNSLKVTVSEAYWTLKKLEIMGIVTKYKRGKRNYYTLKTSIEQALRILNNGNGAR